MANPTTAQVQAIIAAGAYTAVANGFYGPAPYGNPVAPSQGVIDAWYTAMASASTSLPNASAATPLTFYGPNGALAVQSVAAETLTLNTGGTTTDTVANLLPAGSEIIAVLTNVNTAITTAANFSVGDASNAARFKAAQTGIALGNTTIGLDHRNTNLLKQDAAAKVRITCNVNPGAGVVEIVVLYRQYTAPTT